MRSFVSGLLPQRTRLRALFLTGICWIACAGSARALTVLPPSFEQLVEDATDIVRVEVLTVDSRWDNAEGRRVIHTYVTCRVLRTLKGAASDTLTLRLLGGRVGRARLQVPEMPSFAVGDKQVLFVKNNGRAFCPLVGVMHGQYRVQTETATGVERVMRSNREPLVDVPDMSAAMGSTEAGRAAQAAGAKAITLADFEAKIVSQLAHAPRP